MGNGNTVYYNSAGHAFDSKGNPVSNSTIAGAKAGTPTITANSTQPAARKEPPAQQPAPVSQAVAHPAAASPVTGLTPVALGSGQTVYYNSAGHAFDSQGNPVSNATIAARKPPATGGSPEVQVSVHPGTTSAVVAGPQAHPVTASPVVAVIGKAQGETSPKGASSPTNIASQPATQSVRPTLGAQDKQWADTLPPDLKAKVNALPAQTIAQMKEDGQWQTYQQSIKNAAASEQKVAAGNPTAAATSLPSKETTSVTTPAQGVKSASTTSSQDKATGAASTTGPGNGAQAGDLVSGLGKPAVGQANPLSANDGVVVAATVDSVIDSGKGSAEGEFLNHLVPGAGTAYGYYEDKQQITQGFKTGGWLGGAQAVSEVAATEAAGKAGDLTCGSLCGAAAAATTSGIITFSEDEISKPLGVFLYNNHIFQ